MEQRKAADTWKFLFGRQASEQASVQVAAQSSAALQAGQPLYKPLSYFLWRPKPL